MMGKKVQYNQNLALFMACVSLLVFGACSLFQNGGITYNSIIASCPGVLTGVAVMATLGWLIGVVMESSKSVKKANLGYANSLLEEILKEEGLDDLDSASSEDLSDEDMSGLEPESKE